MLNVILFFHFAEGSSVWDKKETGWNIQSWVGQKSEGDYDEEFAKINFKKKHILKKSDDIKKGMPNVLILRKWIAHSHFFKSIILFLVYTTQVKSDFHICWLASSEVNNKYYSPHSSPWDKIAHHEFNSQPSFSILKEINWHVLIYLCGIFWIAIIHLSVSESGTYLSSCKVARQI